MVLLKEYRITNNCTVEEYQIAQLYAVAKMSLSETNNGEGVEVLKNEPYTNSTGSVRSILPESVLQIHEEAWNGYPHCKTVVTNPFMKNKFKVITESMHLPDRGQSENALNLSPENIKIRKVDHIDITKDEDIEKKSYKKEEDPKLFNSKKTGRGPLIGPNWRDTCEPAMTCYKVVTAEFIWFGLQGTIESLIHKTMRQLMIELHRRLYAETDIWYGMTMADLRQLELEATKELDSNPFMKNKFKVITESMHLPDRGQTENALNLSPENIKIRKVDHIDITKDEDIEKKSYKKEEDPKLFNSKKTGRGPLIGPNWRDTCEPAMTCYKVVTAEFIWFGLQGTIESLIHKTMRQLMIELHRRLYAETDIWYGMTMADLRQLELEATKELDSKIKVSSKQPE
ncbi:hypothetical protein BB561_004338 [Smittium simulii]|uniref:Phosphatidylinositol transfer protein N-terminal domain-containing protein n=1 Tax=Smittium simulii TaxID=133385 RepID=A0A2T9YGW7_9FUNG|nr:hypothetical protein BB561_004338 [Smittium simulii]